MEIQEKFEKLRRRRQTPVPISALHGLNIDMLKKEILKRLENYVKASFTAPLTNETMPFISWLLIEQMCTSKNMGMIRFMWFLKQSHGSPKSKEACGRVRWKIRKIQK
jgi:50S ribosomal subunit-associated GTPase HflX